MWSDYQNNRYFSKLQLSRTKTLIFHQNDRLMPKNYQCSLYSCSCSFIPACDTTFDKLVSVMSQMRYLTVTPLILKNTSDKASGSDKTVTQNRDKQVTMTLQNLDNM